MRPFERIAGAHCFCLLRPAFSDQTRSFYSGRCYQRCDECHLLWRVPMTRMAWRTPTCWSPMLISSCLDWTNSRGSTTYCRCRQDQMVYLGKLYCQFRNFYTVTRSFLSLSATVQLRTRECCHRSHCLGLGRTFQVVHCFECYRRYCAIARKWCCLWNQKVHPIKMVHFHLVLTGMIIKFCVVWLQWVGDVTVRKHRR